MRKHSVFFFTAWMADIAKDMVRSNFLFCKSTQTYWPSIQVAMFLLQRPNNFDIIEKNVGEERGSGTHGGSHLED